MGADARHPIPFGGRLQAWVERLFARHAVGLLRSRRRWWASILAVSLLLLAGLPRLTLDVRLNAFLVEDDPDFLAFQAFRQRFENDELLLVVIEPPAGMALLDPEMMAGLGRLHDGVADLDSVVWVSSLARAKRLRVGDESLAWQPWLSTNPTAAERQALLDEESLRGRLIGRQVDSLILRVGLEHSDSVTLVEEIDDLIVEHMPAGCHWSRICTPVLKESLRTALRSDGLRLVPAAAATCLILLAFALRSLRHALLAVGSSLLATLWTLGIMAWVSAPLTVVSVIVPTLILVIGITDGVHLLIATGHGGVRVALKKVGPACFWTTLTTAAGFLGLLLMRVPALASTGIWMAVGVGVALIHAVVTLPLLLHRFPYHPRVAVEEVGQTGWWGAHTARPTIIVAIAALLLLLPGVARLQSETDLVRNFPHDGPLRVAYRHAEAALGGSKPLSILVERLDGGEMITAEALETVSRVREAVVDHPQVLSAQAIPGLIRRLKGEESDRGGRLQRDEAAQLLLLAEVAGLAGPANTLLSTDRRAARILLMLPQLSSRSMVSTASRLRSEARAVVGDGYRVTLVGNALHQANAMDAVNHGLRLGVIVALAVIGLLFRLVLGSWGWSIVASLPNLLPVMGVLGVMGWMGWPVDISTAMTGSVALGLAVDDTIHMALGYRHARCRRMGPEGALRVTIASSGHALKLTTGVMMAGFALLGLSSFAPTRHFGILTCLTLVLALFADLLLLPALIRMKEGRFAATGGELPGEAAGEAG